MHQPWLTAVMQYLTFPKIYYVIELALVYDLLNQGRQDTLRLFAAFCFLRLTDYQVYQLGSLIMLARLNVLQPSKMAAT